MDANAERAREALTALQGLIPAFPAHLFAPDFRMRSCGQRANLDGYMQMWKERRALTAQVTFHIKELVSRGDQVAAVRQGHVTAADGSESTLTVLDVWRVQGGLIVEGEQCWNRLRGPASDDLPFSAKEGANMEAVRQALTSLQDLARVQGSLQARWAPGYKGRVNSLEMDLPALCRHWAALQALLSTVIVDIKDLVAQGSAVGAIYHLLLGKKSLPSHTSNGSREGAPLHASGRSGSCSGEGGPVELRILAVFLLDGSRRIKRCKAVAALVGGGSAEDEQLMTVMAAAEDSG